MDSDADCQPVEWWQHIGFFSRPASPPPAPSNLETSGIYSTLEPGEVCVFWPEGVVVRIQSKRR